MIKYRIIQTNETFLENEINAQFPNVSFALPIHQEILDCLGLEIVTPTIQDIANILESAKAAKRLTINQWRSQANQSTFNHTGKTIACDALSRSDIDAVAGSVSLTGAFPQGFPNAWKAVDNTYISLPNVQAFKDMYASMTLQGTTNFGRSQTLKTSVTAATTIEQLDGIEW